MPGAARKELAFGSDSFALKGPAPPPSPRQHHMGEAKTVAGSGLVLIFLLVMLPLRAGFRRGF